MSDDAMSKAVAMAEDETDQADAVEQIYKCFVDGGQLEGGFDTITILKAALLYAAKAEDGDVSGISFRRLEIEVPNDASESTIVVNGVLVY